MSKNKITLAQVQNSLRDGLFRQIPMAVEYM